MKILYLAHRVPYPPNRGDRIRSFHHLRHLAGAHEVSLVAFAARREEEQPAAALRSLCRSVDLVPLDPALAWARGASALARGRPFVAGYFGASEMWAVVRRLAAEQSFDAAWSYSSAMAQYLAASGARRRVADFTDADSEKWREYADHGSLALRWIYGLEARAQRRFESRASLAADRVLFVAEEEAAAFRRFAPPAARVEVVPNGVDTEFFHPAPEHGEGNDADVLFTGTLDYPPNVDAVLFLVREILPLVRTAVAGVRLTAVGRDPSRRLVAASRDDSTLTLTGEVRDVRPHFAAARAYAAPLRFGRGVKNKVLEAMAMGVPVVASPTAVMGLAVRDGIHVRLAEGPPEFAAALVELMNDPAQRRALSQSALELIRREYRWETLWPRIDACLDG